MRRLSALLGGYRKLALPLELTAADIRLVPAASRGEGAAPDVEPLDLKALSSEVEQVADYVARLRREVAVLRPGLISHDQMPTVRDELESVRSETFAAVERIMAAAETMLAADPGSLDGYRTEVADRVTEVIEACSFQDLVGQRLVRATALLREMEKKIDRFARAVNIPDAADVFDRDAILREMRKEVLLVEGPQATGAAIDQDAIDKMFG